MSRIGREPGARQSALMRLNIIQVDDIRFSITFNYWIAPSDTKRRYWVQTES